MGAGPGALHPSRAGAGSRVGRDPEAFDGFRIGREHTAWLEGSGHTAKLEANIRALEVLDLVTREVRGASSSEAAELARFSGWGQFPQVFEPHRVEWDERATWNRRRERIGELLGGADSDAYASAAATTLNAHYTHPDIARWMWETVRSMGFTGGRVLEPSAGTGNFLGACPTDLAARSSFVAVEIDPTTAAVARALYPDARVRIVASPFEDAQLPDGYFDLAISNVPFGDYQVFDAAVNREYAQRTGLRIHNYFFAAAARKVREGGLIAFISSSGTLDATSSKAFRRRLGDDLDFLGAVRLPSSAFAKSAGTEVTTDVLFFERRAAGLAASHAGPWFDTVSVGRGSGSGAELRINEWYAERRLMMLGRLAEDKLHHARAGLEPDGRDLGGLLEIVRSELQMPRGERRRDYAVEIETGGPLHTIADVPRWTREGGYVVGERDGELALSLLERGALVEQKASGEAIRRIRDALVVRDALRSLLEMERTVDDGPEIDESRNYLNSRYDEFRSRWGTISSTTNRRALRRDADYPVLVALERVDRTTGRTERAAIFSTRVVARPVRPSRVESLDDAVRLVLAESGHISVDRIATLVGADERAVRTGILREGLAFLDPAGDRLVARDEYLSGDVVAKLETARRVAGLDEGFRSNVQALEAVQPERLVLKDIGVRLGAGWIPEQLVEAFIHEISECKVTARYVAPTAEWVVEVRSYSGGVRNLKEFGTAHFTAVDLTELALNLRLPTVVENLGTHKVVQFAETEEARAKQDRIKSRFVEWLLEEPGRASTVEQIYNDLFNRTRLREHDSTPFAIAGLSADWVEGGPKALRPHQYASIRRVSSGQSTLLAHVVGAGKTAEIIIGAMELRRMGLSSKPMVVVPNHLVGQFAADFRDIFPGADLLVQGDTDFAKQNRARFLARIATSTPDAVVLSHSAFGMIPVRADAQSAFIESQIGDLELALWSLGKGDRGAQKKIQASKKRLEARLGRLFEVGRDETMTFEELGVDRLFVDESHAFKNLAYQTKLQRVAGLSDSESKRAEDMYLKTGYIERLWGRGQGIVFASGTPITNTIAEAYTLERFMARTDLRRRGLAHFDAWVALYADPVTGWETDSIGRFTVKTRFAGFRNVPELRTSVRRFADVRTAEDLRLPAPERADGKPVAVVCPQNGLQRATLSWLEERVNRLRSAKVDPSIDNMLKITTDARKMSIDARLLFGAAGAFRSGKVAAAAEVIHHVWAATAEARATQIVFSDLGTPNTDRAFSVYDELRRELVGRGVPDSEIAFIHDFAKQDEKRRLFEDVNAGRVRVIVGSSQKLGAGANVQRRMVAIHQIDVPWLPADIEQRNGRVERQGNLCREFWEFRYVATGDKGRAGFDSYMWEMIGRKGQMIQQVMGREDGQRSIEDVAGRPLSAAEFQAVAHGNPLLREKIEVDAARSRLERLRRAWYDDRRSIAARRGDLPHQIAATEARLACLRVDVELAASLARREGFEMTVLGTVYRERVDAGKGIRDRALDMQAGQHETVGRLGEFDVEVERAHSSARIILRGREVDGRRIGYEASVTDTDAGTIASIYSRLRSIPQTLTTAEGELSGFRREGVRIAELLEKGFEDAGELERLEARAREIDTELGIGRTDEQAAATAATAAASGSVSQDVSVDDGASVVANAIETGEPVRPDPRADWDDPVPLERPWLPDPDRLRAAVAAIIEADRDREISDGAAKLERESRAPYAEPEPAPPAALPEAPAPVVDEAKLGEVTLDALRNARLATEVAARRAREGREERDAERQVGNETGQLKLF